MSEIVERVAQALFDRECARSIMRGREPHHRKGTRVADMPPSYRDDYLSDARAMIEAMREPTPEILAACSEFAYAGWSDTNVLTARSWRAAIDAALE